MRAPTVFICNSIRPTLTSFLIRSGPQAAALTTQVANPMAGTNPNPSLNGATVAAGQLERPYPQYNGLSLAGYGCCGSSYNSLQATVTRRFQGGGTLLVAYTNAKLLSNTDTLTSWLEGPTGGVGGVQDWNNLREKDRSRRRTFRSDW